MKKILCLALALLLTLTLSLPAFAANYNDEYYRVTDKTGTLTSAERDTFDNRICSNIENLQMDFAVYVQNDMDDMDAVAASVYQNSNYGYGANKDCIFLLVDLQKLTYIIRYYGGAQSLSDTVKDAIASAFEEGYNASRRLSDGINAFLNTAFSKVSGGSYNYENVTSTPWWYPEDPAGFVDFHGENLPHVVDDANLLTASQKADLESKISAMIAKYGFDIVVYTTPTVYGYSNMMNCAADFYVYQGYGVGDDFSGLVFFHSVETGNRGWRTVCFGKAMSLFTSYRINAIDDMLYDLFVAGNHYEAYSLFLEKAAYVLEDKDPPAPFNFMTLLTAIVVGLVIGLIIAGMRISSMKKKMVLPRATAAGNYIVPGSTVVRNIKTTFLYSNVVRHAKPKSSSSGGGSSFGSGSSSSGRSFSGGGRNY